MSKKPIQLLPIYTTSGEVGAFLYYPYILNLQGEWIGWITKNKKVYSVHGHNVGYITNEPRILRNKSHDFNFTRLTPPTPPPQIIPPTHLPLAPQLSELSMTTIDILDEDPNLLPSIDFGELRKDLD